MRLIRTELLRDIDAMKFERPLSHLCAHIEPTKNTRHSWLCISGWFLLDRSVINGPWYVRSLPYGVRWNKERQEQRLSQDIRSVPCEYGRSIRDDSCAPRLREFIIIAIELRGKFMRIFYYYCFRIARKIVLANF